MHTRYLYFLRIILCDSFSKSYSLYVCLSAAAAVRGDFGYSGDRAVEEVTLGEVEKEEEGKEEGGEFTGEL